MQFFMILALIVSFGKTIVVLADEVKPCKAATLSVGESCLTSKGFTFTLLERTETGSEIYMDEKSGFIWGDALNERYTLDDAEDQRICENDASKESRGGENAFLKGQKFRLPSKRDFQTADDRGFREVLPNMKRCVFWSTTDDSFSRSGDLFFAFNGDDGFDSGIEKSYNRSFYSLSVRCVACSADDCYLKQ